jgi:hypothetical protein
VALNLITQGADDDCIAFRVNYLKNNASFDAVQFVRAVVNLILGIDALP